MCINKMSLLPGNSLKQTYKTHIDLSTLTLAILLMQSIASKLQLCVSQFDENRDRAFLHQGIDLLLRLNLRIPGCDEAESKKSFVWKSSSRSVLLSPRSVLLFIASMKFIKLHYKDREMFDPKLDISEYIFFHSHRDVFRQMMKEQGKEFWVRFMLTFRTASTKFGVVGRLLKHLCGQSCRENHVMMEHMVDWFFIQLHNIIIEGTVGDCKQLIDDIALLAQNQHIFRNVFCKSLTKDPFYMPSTRDAFRRLFGSQLEKMSYMRTADIDLFSFQKGYVLLKELKQSLHILHLIGRVTASVGKPTVEIVMFPVYETFAGAWCRCLRRWVDACEMADATDQSYWIQPTNDSPNEDVDMNMDQQFNEYLKLAMALEKERNMGSAKGPMFVQGWPKGADPRFIEPSNPLYNPKAKQGSDWRDDIDFGLFVKFIVFCQEKAALADKTVISKLNGRFEPCTMCGFDPPEISQLNKVFSEKLDIIKSDLKSDEDEFENYETVEKMHHKTTKSTAKKAKRSVEIQQPVCEKSIPHKSQDGCSTKRKESEQVILTGTPKTGKQETVLIEQEAETTVVKIFTEATTAPDTLYSVNDSYNSKSILSENGSRFILDENGMHEKVKKGNVLAKVDSLAAGSPTTTCQASTENHDATNGRLRVCSNCLQPETRPHEFKKCKKCKDMKFKNAKYYCGRDCQVADWDRHRLEHRTAKTLDIVAAVAAAETTGDC